MLSLLHRAAARRMRWKNGLGWTTELASQPTRDKLVQGEFDWRVSIAEVDADAEFSAFPGIDRSILVLAGAGMLLEVGERAPVELRERGKPLRFSGDSPARASLLGGPTRDFNVMTRRGVFDHLLTSATLGPPLPLERAPGRAWLVHVLRGHAVLDSLQVEADDSVLCECESGDAAPLLVRGAGELVLVQLDRAG